MVFGLEDLCRHTMIFGSSGSGKTTRAYNPLLADMLGRLQCGAFLIASKGKAVHEAVGLARLAGREALVVEPGGDVGIDLLTGNPDLDAMYFAETFGHLRDDGKQWIDAAVARMRNALRLLLSAGQRYYTFEYLTAYCFDEKFAAMVRIQAMERLRSLDADADEAWTIREAISYEDTRFMQFTSDARRSIQFAVSQLLEPLRDARIAKTFGTRTEFVDLESVFDGKVIVLHVPRARYERAAQSIYTIAKRRFFTALERRRNDPALDQARPVAFGIDEYEWCISESDVRSLGVARAAGCMMLCTTQAVSSLYAALPHHVVDATLQNFTQKIFFKTDDYDTLSLLERAVQHTTNKIDAHSLFAMTRNQALAHVTVGDHSVDAILTMEPLFVD